MRDFFKSKAAANDTISRNFDRATRYFLSVVLSKCFWALPNSENDRDVAMQRLYTKFPTINRNLKKYLAVR